MEAYFTIADFLKEGPPKILYQQSKPLKVGYIEADGNCLFRSVAFCLAGSDDEHIAVRQSVAKFEKKYDDQFREIKNMTGRAWKKHLSGIATEGKWATEVEIFALASLLEADIWTYLDGKWLRYRPLFVVEGDGALHS
ncbi:unnamed protein product [Gongylonema pulchrum]|uniref:OTU domain-containing protein n=1 Tax=Gongylonema pulchrum TaxID=637853 RepID=A0A183EBP3_9BILA|nr:unnamed protein product [Gongylonema pulchrum]